MHVSYWISVACYDFKLNIWQTACNYIVILPKLCVKADDFSNAVTHDPSLISLGLDDTKALVLKRIAAKHLSSVSSNGHQYYFH